MSLNVNISVRSTNICLLFGVFYRVVNTLAGPWLDNPADVLWFLFRWL